MRLFQSIAETFSSHRIAIGFGVALVLVGFGFSMSFLSYSRSQYDNQRLAQSFQVINRIETILSLLKDVETGSRGYMASGDRQFLAPYLNARPRLRPEFEHLKRLVRDNPTQQRAVDSLGQLAEGKLAITRQQIKLQRTVADSVRRTYLLEEKRRMDRVRAQAARLIATEQILMEQRNLTAKRSHENTLAIIFALSLLTFVVLVTLYKLLSDELRRRADSETQLRDYEQELQDKVRQLEMSNQELERMAFVASHDMQEPLRKIQAFGGLLTERFSPRLEADGQMFLNKIITSADRMSLLIRDLLNFSRLSSRRESFAPTSLNNLVDQVISDLDLAIQEKKAVVSREDLPMIDAAPSQLTQLFTNLISNALKYVKPGVPPQVRITADAINGHTYPGLLADEPYLRLTITDNGIGFNEKYLDRIFEIFQRLHTKAKYQGTGIGLAICKRVVTYHNGYITAQSQEGVGTSFIIALPYKQPGEGVVANVPDEESVAS